MSDPRYKYRKRPDAGTTFPYDVIDTADGNRVVLASAPAAIIVDVVEALNAVYERGREDGREEAAQR